MSIWELNCDELLWYKYKMSDFKYIDDTELYIHNVNLEI